MALILSLLLLLSSCVSTPPAPSSPNAWETAGSFAVKKQTEGWSGYFEWSQYSKTDYQIHFYGPFGVNNTYLIGQKHRVVWKDNQGITTAATPEALIYEKTGSLFPVSYLYYWIQGKPAPGSVEKKQWNEKNQLIAFHQGGWDIYYLSSTKIELIYHEIHIKLILQHRILLDKLKDRATLRETIS